MKIRDFKQSGSEAVNAVVHAAWAEFESVMPGWSLLSERLGSLVEKAEQSEVVVVEQNGRIIGAAGYVSAKSPKPDFFPREWPIVRLMSVAPECRGLGVGCMLLDECIARAKRDSAPVLALHTTPIMQHAQQLYRGADFEHYQDLPPMWGVPYVLLVKQLDSNNQLNSADPKCA